MYVQVRAPLEVRGQLCVLSFHLYVGSGDQTQVLRLMQSPSLLSHLAGRPFAEPEITDKLG